MIKILVELAFAYPAENDQELCKNPKRIIRLIHKLCKHFGLFFIFKIIVFYINKSICLSAHEFRKSQALNKIQ